MTPESANPAGESSEGRDRADARADAARESGAEVLRPSTGPVVGSVPDGTVALVVDDEERVRAMVTELLSRAGFSCLEAESAEQALELLDEHSPGIGVLDIALPGISGAELAWRIRKKLPGVPLVALTGHLAEWGRDDLEDLGFDRVFAKPMDCDEFVGFCVKACRPPKSRPDA